MKRFRVAFLLPLLLVSGQPQASAPAKERPLVKALTFNGQAFDDVADALHIKKKSGQIQLNAVNFGGGLQIDFYRQGKQLPRSIKFGTMLVEDQPRVPHQLDFCVHIIDMDYLLLSGGKKDHCRIHLKLGEKGSAMWSDEDLPKTVFDFSKVTASGRFRTIANSKEKIPLFWFLAKTNVINSFSDTVEQLIANNKDCDVAVISLTLADAK